MNSSNGEATGTVSLTRETGNATITVTDGISPLSGATVSVTVNGTARSATTTSSGEAQFTNLPTGTYAFTATKSGYDDGTGSVTVSTGATATGSISMAPQLGAVLILVTDGYHPLSYVTVKANVNGTILSGQSDSNGYVPFTSLPVGTYNFYVPLDGTNKDVTVIKNQTVSETLTLHVD